MIFSILLPTRTTSSPVIGLSGVPLKMLTFLISARAGALLLTS
jgi:hypothetical protein